ncbi:MAG: formylglycine-generating enzyme family protein [Planctomycetes bacterium]|nr:formylglycine-generating enzyme family protein [Planctomycetota bacterium]
MNITPAPPPAMFSAKAAGWVALCLAGWLFALGGCSWKGLVQQRKEMPPSAGAWKIYEGWPFAAREAANRQQQTAQALNVPKDYILDLGGGTSIRFVLIPAGRFVMGSPDDEAEHQLRESPAHEVVLTRPYYMSAFEVTQEQYKAVCGHNPAEFKDPARPVEGVTWSDAAGFCEKLSARTGLKIALPAEAQWEFACRAGAETPFNTGRNITTDQANYDGNYSYAKGPKGEFRDSTTQAGVFAPNAFGLCDMHGNVWEWCRDWLDDNEYHVGATMAIDPAGAPQGENKVLRGGCWYLNPGFARSAYRNSLPPAMFNNQIGFRLVMEIPGVGSAQGNFDIQTKPADKGPAQPQGQPQPPSTQGSAGPFPSDGVAQNPPSDPSPRVPQPDPDPIRPPPKQPDPPVRQPVPPPVRPVSPPVAQPKNSELVFTDWPFDKDQAAQRQSRTAQALGVEPQLELDLGGGASIKLSLIPAGRFTMGSPDNEKGRRNAEGPQHQVTIARPFYMGICEITQKQYQAVAGENPSGHKNPDNPVEKVTWTNATAFCLKRSEKTGRMVRLPTEAQWEYACRAGAAGRFCYGDKDSSLSDYCWYLASAGHQTHPVAQKAANAFGLQDMHGNVWEWCSDWYTETYPTEDAADPAGPQTGTWRVVRGGAWDAAPQDCRSAVRSKFLPDKQEESYGFRIVVEAEKGKAVAPPVNPPINPPPVNPPPVATRPDDTKLNIDWTPLPPPQSRPAPPPPPPDVPKGFLELLAPSTAPASQPDTQKAGQ